MQALICMKSAPTLSSKQFSCLTYLDQNRAVALAAQKLQVLPPQIKNVIIWGNHSCTATAPSVFSQFGPFSRISQPPFPPPSRAPCGML